MSDRAALLRAIIDDPDEDTPRLVYADWLDEQGDSKRAAYIRAQIAQDRADQADTTAGAVDRFLERNFYAGPNRVDWDTVDAELGAARAVRRAAAKQRVKLSPKGEAVPRIKGVSFYPDERGFYGGVMVHDPDAFLRHADAIFRAAPVTSLLFWKLTGAQAADFARSGHLARVRSLDFEEDVEPDAVRVIGSSKDAAGVRTLELETDDFAECAEALAEGPFWTGLQTLTATDPDGMDGLPTEGWIAELLGRKPFRGLREFTAHGASVEDDDAKRVAKHLPELRHADFSYGEISAPGQLALAASKLLHHLRSLELGYCGDDPKALSELINTNNLPNLAVLTGGGKDSELDAKTLKKPGRGPMLRVRDLDSSRLSPAALEALVMCPAVRGVWHLRLGDTGIGDEHLERFVAHGAFECLAALDLHSNHATARGARALAAWPGAAHLQWLDLGSNPIGESGAKALAASPHLTGLKSLHFEGRGTAILKRRFKKAFG